MFVRLFRRVFVGRSAVGRSVKIDLDSFHGTVKLGEGQIGRSVRFRSSESIIAAKPPNT